jgi:sulfur carrier protein
MNMKVIIRRPRREVEMSGSRRVRDLLRELQINPETVLVVRGQDLLTPDEIIKDEETVEVVSAISGGANDEV